MNDFSKAPAVVPQLRTLLLTDLCDSTALVERIGDAAAVAVFREHDRLVLELQQRWRGRLIDRSDGMLLLFERPIDGLGFALDYERGVRAIGTARDVTLTARAGLHVGEVLTWRNSDEAVQVGAKPLEVEGLAKPMAGRLMSMARPGQILMSAVAEPLAYRATRELGERGAHLAWKNHGRWHFKGVPGTQEIFEVGEPGIAPLRMPASTPKAWRAVPLWRRPRMLAAQAAVLACLAGGAWVVLRPQPAIAFHQRDWVVVGDLRNLTGQKVLDDSLQQAFRISLEQSRHVNVLSELKARDTLKRMQRAPDTTLDRAVASEIALREGARAVILPTVAEVGGRVRFGVELVDPKTQATVYAKTVDGRDASSVLDIVDSATGSLREHLGEGLQTIGQSTAPLPEVSTSNLDALRAYSIAQKAYASQDYDEALRLYQRATEIDPQFALAWLGQMRVQYVQVNAPGAVDALNKARALRHRLVTKEALYLDAWVAEFEDPGRALHRWQEIAKIFPDHGPAQSNSALWLLRSNRFQDALAYARSASASRNTTTGVDYDSLGRAYLGMQHYGEAVIALDAALSRGFASSQRRKMAVEAAQRRFDRAKSLGRKFPLADRHYYIERTSVALDQARWHEAGEFAHTGLELAQRASGYDARSFNIPLAVVEWQKGDVSAALKRVRTVANATIQELSKPNSPDARQDAELALAASIIALRLGDVRTAVQVDEAIGKRKDLKAAPVVAELRTIVQAYRMRASGQAESAVKSLTALINGHERYQARVALLEAYVDAGDYRSAVEQAQWLQSRRGQAYAELQCGYCLQSLNVVDSNLADLREAELLYQVGQTEQGKSALQRFDRQWPVESLPAHLRTRRSSVNRASN